MIELTLQSLLLLLDKFDFDKIFDGADWFHFTGITPAVSDVAAEVTEAALKAAKAKALLFLVTLTSERNYGLQKRLRRL